jgi:FixJ family two-component response regulator
MARERYIARCIQHWHVVLIGADGTETVMEITDSEESAKVEAARLEREAERTWRDHPSQTPWGQARNPLDRERHVFDRIVLGHSNRAVAEQLDIAERNVEIYRANVMTKMQARSLSNLVRLAMTLK